MLRFVLARAAPQARNRTAAASSSGSCHRCAAALASALFFSASTASAQGGGQTAIGLLARQTDGSHGPVAYDLDKTPFGLRANNWVGLKGPNLRGRWPGQTGANAQHFTSFEDPAYAIRAFIDLVRQY